VPPVRERGRCGAAGPRTSCRSRTSRARQAAADEPDKLVYISHRKKRRSSAASLPAANDSLPVGEWQCRAARQPELPEGFYDAVVKECDRQRLAVAQFMASFAPRPIRPPLDSARCRVRMGYAGSVRVQTSGHGSILRAFWLTWPNSGLRRDSAACHRFAHANGVAILPHPHRGARPL